jgi:hypothetical protein
MTTVLTAPSTVNRCHDIEALFALLSHDLLSRDLDDPRPRGTSNFSSAPAAHVPGPEWPPEQWD